MGPSDQPKSGQTVWSIGRSQDGAIGTEQLLELGFNFDAIAHRVDKGRLHPKWPGVFAVGRPELSQRGQWIAALLSCGEEAALSNGSAMAYYGLAAEDRGIEVSVPHAVQLRRDGLTVHRRRDLAWRHIRVDGPIRVTNPVLTLIDYAASHGRDAVEQAINDADRRDVVDAETVRLRLTDYVGWHGAPLLRDVLDARTFTMTDSELERRMRPIFRRVGLSNVLTQQWVNGYRVDFYCPVLGLVVETDGLRYHRTAAQQTVDRLRDQAHTAAGLTVLRFTRWQVRYDRKHVESVLGAVAKRLGRQASKARPSADAEPRGTAPGATGSRS